MSWSLFGKKRPETVQFPSSVNVQSPAAEHRIYAIGDIHGMASLLEAMFVRLKLEVALDGWTGGFQVITLGDYIDRGPDSRGVVERLTRETRLLGRDLIALRGNHEDLFLRFLEDPQACGPAWLDLGGEATLQSYGVKLPLGRPDFIRLRHDLTRRIPLEHLAFLQNLPVSFSAGGYFFCHAEPRSGIPLAKQTQDDLLWHRSSPGQPEAQFERIVVHGHTPVSHPMLRNFSINIDTGAYATQRLTALKIDPHGCSFIEISDLDVVRNPLTHERLDVGHDK
jgi:serine/threonine protein phosphatase 1